MNGNRRNALASTGPKTAEGKARVAMNGLRHGIFCQYLLTKSEKPEDLDALKEDMYRELQPQGIVEEMLVDKMINAVWRLRRVARADTSIMDDGLNVFGKAKSPDAPFRQHNCLSSMLKYEAALERAYYRAKHELERMKDVRAGKQVDAPQVVHRFGEEGA